ncbi:MAG TPA: CHASE2 domain-containing protein [Oxalicibacterium sp.]|nr:CHASE2 domain-containing protein [Oxalicibacterium sp.]
MKRRWLSPLVRRLTLREWLALFVGMLVVSAVMGWQNGLGRLDQSRYDLFMSTDTRPVRDDIIIVAIDDYSLSQLGRWPWPRSLHAQLIRKLNQAKPRAIGLDVILSEAEAPQAGGGRSGDAALAAALAQSGRTVLPVAMTNAGQGLTVALPVPELARAAHALGHINLEHDSDGVVRSVFLHEGQHGVWWPHFAAALLATGNPAQTLKLPTAEAAHTSVTGVDRWQRADQMHIAYSGGVGHFRSVPYVSVLRGEVPAEFFTGKYVLIGATALGMADSYPTPVSGSSGAMPGIEIHAQILSGLLDHRSIYIAPHWMCALFTMVPVLLAMIGYLWLSPRLSLLTMGLWMLAVVLASYFGLRFGVWFPPSAALIMLALSYPLWSWRRLEAAITYLGQEFTRLDREPHLLPEEPRSRADEMTDILDQRITAMKNAARRVRDLRRFVSENLDSLPDITLVTSIDGRILLANKHADDYYRALGLHDVRDMSVLDLLAGLKSPQPMDTAPNVAFKWADLLDVQRADALVDGVSVQDRAGRDLLVKSAPCHSAATQLTGWIVSIIDISPIRAAERSRDETLRFLSHDMRAPQASILALLELQGEAASSLPQQELFARIEKAARKTLGLADNFVQLARAESHEYRLEEVDFQDLLLDATDEMWSLVTAKHIAISVQVDDGDYWVKVDRTLMTRALTNLLSNAINYSPENTAIACSVWAELHEGERHVVCRIQDHGYGIAPADQARLFQRFRRVDSPNQPRHEGVGLGLVFVKTVIERHNGEIHFSSVVGEGTTFTLSVPAIHVSPSA